MEIHGKELIGRKELQDYGTTREIATFPDQGTCPAYFLEKPS